MDSWASRDVLVEPISGILRGLHSWVEGRWTVRLPQPERFEECVSPIRRRLDDEDEVAKVVVPALVENSRLDEVLDPGLHRLVFGAAPLNGIRVSVCTAVKLRPTSDVTIFNALEAFNRVLANPGLDRCE